MRGNAENASLSPILPVGRIHGWTNVIRQGADHKLWAVTQGSNLVQSVGPILSCFAQTPQQYSWDIALRSWNSFKGILVVRLPTVVGRPAVAQTRRARILVLPWSRLCFLQVLCWVVRLLHCCFCETEESGDFCRWLKDRRLWSHDQTVLSQCTWVCDEFTWVTVIRLLQIFHIYWKCNTCITSVCSRRSSLGGFSSSWHCETVPVIGDWAFQKTALFFWGHLVF